MTKRVNGGAAAAFLAVLITATSCLEDIDIGGEENLPVVVTCVLRKDSVQTLRLYRMRKLYGSESQPVTDAEVFILQAGAKQGTFDTAAVFHRTQGSSWQASFEPSFSRKYDLVVRRPGEGDITASTRFPRDLRLRQYGKVLERIESDSDGKIRKMPYRMFTAEVCIGRYVDKIDIDGNFLPKIDKETGEPIPFKVYNLVDEGSSKIWIFPHVDTTFVIPYYYDTFDYQSVHYGVFFEEDMSFKGSSQPYARFAVSDHPGTDGFNITQGRLADLDWCNKPIEELSGYQREYSNASQWCLFMCPDLPLHERFLRIDHPEHFRNGLSEKDLENSYQHSTRSFLVCGDYNTDYPAICKRTVLDYPIYTLCNSFINEVRFVSDEYDAYLRALYVKRQNRDDFILSSYDYENVYTNISGGVGIFGAEYITWDE